MRLARSADEGRKEVVRHRAGEALGLSTSSGQRVHRELEGEGAFAVRMTARALVGLALLLVLVYLVITPPTPVHSSWACSTKASAHSVVDSTTGKFACACAPGHACVLPGPSGQEAYCGAGTIAIRHNALDRLPGSCEQCKCREVSASLIKAATAPRIIFASVPRSGNSWMRQLLELSSGTATETVFREAYHAPRDGAGENEEIQAGLIVGSNVYGHTCGRSNYCSRVSLPEPGMPRIVKTHAPFLSSRHEEQGTLISDAGVGAVLLLPVRNPLDNFDAWRRYHASSSQKKRYPADTLASFLDAWAAHHNYWLHSPIHEASEKVVYRFEDMVDLREPLLGHMLQHSGLWSARGLVARNVCFALEQPRLRPRPKDKSRASEEHFAQAWATYTREEVELALEHEASRELLEHFGYAALYRAWLQRMAGDVDDAALHSRVRALWHVTRTRLYASWYKLRTQGNAQDNLDPSRFSPFHCTQD